MPDTAPDTWYRTAWTRLSAWISKTLGQVDLGADWRAGNVTRPEYDVQTSMSAMAAFPWVYAALMRASADLGGLQLRLYRRRRGGRAEEITDRAHPVLRILRQPHPSYTGRQLRRQLYVDLRLTGNAFLGHVGDGAASILTRLHPRRVELEPDGILGIGRYIYTGSGERQPIDPADMYHVRTPSWRDDPRGLFGTGAIESLHDDLTTDRRAAKSAANMAKRPRPDIIVSSNEDGGLLTKAVREEIGKQLDKLLGEGGTLVLPSNLKVDMPSWKPADMEFQAQRNLVREGVLAVFNIPPHLLGLPVANYAQAREQTLVYWEFQQTVAADLEDAWLNPFAESFDPDLYLMHDFSRIDALQAARDSRLKRVQGWVAIGGDPAKAAAYEGFDDLPDGIFTSAAPAPAPAPAPAKSLPWLRAKVPTKAERWAAFVKDVHGPAETRWSAALSVYLADQAERLAERAGEIQRTLRRDLVDDILAAIWDSQAEATALQEVALLSEYETVASGWRWVADQVGLTISYDPQRTDPYVQQQLGRLVQQVSLTTQAAVRQIVTDSIAAGETIAEMQARIQGAAAFSPARALAIARTETTRAINAGSLVAYQQAVEVGVSVKKEWLAAIADSRDAHIALDGQVRDVGEDFVVPSGEYIGEAAPGPGEFSKAALCVNCRCTTIPVLESKDGSDPA